MKFNVKEFFKDLIILLVVLAGILFAAISIYCIIKALLFISSLLHSSIYVVCGIILLLFIIFE